MTICTNFHFPFDRRLHIKFEENWPRVFRGQVIQRCEWTMEHCGAVVKHRTGDREVPGSIPTYSKCCFLEQETLSTLLSTGFYPGKKRATWKISTRLLNVLPSINKVDYYYYYYGPTGSDHNSSSGAFGSGELKHILQCVVCCNCDWRFNG